MTVSFATANAPSWWDVTPQRPKTRWVGGALLALGLHGAVVAAIALPWRAPEVPRPAATAPILIDMPPVAPPAAQPPPMPQDPVVPMDPVDVPPLDIPPPPVVEKAEVAVPTIPDTPKPTPPPKPAERPQEPPKPDPPPQQEAPPKPQPDPPPQTEPAPSEAPASPPSSVNTTGETAAAANSGATVQDGARQQQRITWEGAVLAHLERHKRYPRAAQIRRQTGVALVIFTLNAQGQVSAARLAQSSGYRLLDREALSLPERASPLPAPPAALGGGSITLTVPIEFFIQ